MKMNKKVALVLLMFIIALPLCAASCGEQIPPNGRYEPVDENVAMLVMQAIIIDGNNFTMVQPITGVGVTVKYEYNKETGAITIIGEGAGATVCEYKDGSIWYSSAEFKKVDD